MYWLLLVVAMAFNAAANLALKHSARLAVPGASPWDQLLSPSGVWLAIGVLLFALNVLVYRKALEGVPVTVAYPVMAAGAVALVVSLGMPLFHERLSAIQWMGLACVALGVILVTRTAETRSPLSENGNPPHAPGEVAPHAPSTAKEGRRP